jgi:hypothetical protein
MQSRRHAHLTCTSGACEYMIAKQMNMANLEYHMHIVLYFRVLIRSSFGAVCEHRYMDIYVHTESLLTANKKIDDKGNPLSDFITLR